ncbi:hypothetical protein Syun_007676 [Stephania yunnanensis]|uniref:Uncharacterized protein n=1 Tax=Stephania yunnanensis TaxID=152371 RepID=A0AAP0PZJ2_9MAGN
MRGLSDPGDHSRFPANGAKCWRVREKECLILGRSVSMKSSVWMDKLKKSKSSDGGLSK